MEIDVLNPKVSIVIPVYNGSNYLREAIDSALAQTYRNVEVIVVNDGSTDNGRTEEIAKSYGDKIRYFAKKNGGVASALNLGIREMKGEYFSWLSHDDVYMSDKLEVQIEQLRNETGPVVLYGDYYLIDSRSRLTGRRNIRHVPPDEFVTELVSTFPVNGCTTLIPRQCFLESGLFNEQLKTSQDYEMWFRLSQKYPFVHISKPLVKYRNHRAMGSLAMNDILITEGNGFFVKCLDTFSPTVMFKSRKQTVAMSYLGLAMNYKVRGFSVAEKHALTLARQHLERTNMLRFWYEYLVVELCEMLPKFFLFRYWKLAADFLKERMQLWQELIMEDKMEDKAVFSFGKNWDDFIRTSLTEQRISEAMKSLKEFLGVQRLDGLTFLDVGSGSGLFSLAAYRLGARKVISFDLDPFSVACTEYLREKEGSPENWSIQSGSILDRKFTAGLDRADVVYSWGVLHHTGNIWKAIEDAIELVRPGGALFIAIYNNVEGVFGSQSWLKLKRLYNRVSVPVRHVLEFGFLSLVIAKMLLTLKNPIEEFSRYKERRGMSLMTDIRDSLGGYPYEYASAEEVFRFCRERKLHLENLKTVNDLGLNEFLFRKMN